MAFCAIVIAYAQRRSSQNDLEEALPSALGRDLSESPADLCAVKHVRSTKKSQLSSAFDYSGVEREPLSAKLLNHSSKRISLQNDETENTPSRHERPACDNISAHHMTLLLKSDFSGPSVATATNNQRANHACSMASFAVGLLSTLVSNTCANRKNSGFVCSTQRNLAYTCWSAVNESY